MSAHPQPGCSIEAPVDDAAARPVPEALAHAWDSVDESSWESFPASDPPSFSPREPQPVAPAQPRALRGVKLALAGLGVAALFAAWYVRRRLA